MYIYIYNIFVAISLLCVSAWCLMPADVKTKQEIVTFVQEFELSSGNLNLCFCLAFCGQVNNNKIEQLQERPLGIIYNDEEIYFQT